MNQNSFQLYYFIFALFSQLAVSNIDIVVTNGYVNYSEIEFGKKLYTLNGEWEFYDSMLLTPDKIKTNISKRQFVPVPAKWSKYRKTATGYGTYRIQIQLPENHNDYFILLPEIGTSYKIWINGKMLGECGKISTIKKDSEPQYLKQFYELSAEKKVSEIIIQVSNYHNVDGGLWDEIRIGTKEAVQFHIYLNNTLEIIVIGILFFLGIYHLVLFSKRRKSLELLYFSIFIIILILRIIVTSSEVISWMIQDIPWSIKTTINFITMPLTLITYLLFISQLFSDESNPRITKIIYTFLSFYSLFILLTPPSVFTRSAVFGQIIMALSSLYVLWIIIKGSIEKREGSKFIIFGTVIIMFSIINDILYANQIIYTGYTLHIGATFFLISQSFSLAYRFTSNLTELENLKIDLEQTNEKYSYFFPIDYLKQFNKTFITELNYNDRTNKKITILSSDIRDFTPLSENMTPQETFNLLNSYMSKVGPIIRANNGFIEKYIGDAIISVFPESTQDSINSAIEMQKFLSEYNEGRMRAGYLPIKTGVGIHVDEAVIRVLGDNNRMSITIISDIVDFADKLEQLTKYFGTSIIISEDTIHNASESVYFNARLLGYYFPSLENNNKKAIYEIITDTFRHESIMKLNTKYLFEKGLQAFHKRSFADSVNYFQEILNENPQDKACRIYYKQSLYLQNRNLPDNWKGLEMLCEN